MHVRHGPRVARSPDPPAGPDELPARHGHAAEVLIGRDERPAAHADGPPATRDPPGEAHAAAARGQHPRTGRRREIHATVLAGREAIRAHGEGPQHGAFDRPQPAARGRRRRRSALRKQSEDEGDKQ